MECVANYEIRSTCSIVADDRVLEINHPQKTYRARIRNIPRSDFTTPFLLSLHLYFNAFSLDEAPDVVDEILADCLNMLVFTTGAEIQRHRLRQIVDASPDLAMRSVLFWSDRIDNEDPQPFFDESITKSIERLLSFDMPAPLRRALRWYRLGANAKVPDDQFMNFWFALEIIAEFKKSPDKLPSKCPKCQSSLYCESCKTHPLHRPYPKQSIIALIKAIDKECTDEAIKRLDNTRNGLMHGSTLKEMEDREPETHEHIVDVLGHLVLKALINQFPHTMFDGQLAMGAPSTYVRRNVHGVIHMQTIVPVDADGNFKLDFLGFKAGFTQSGPPQSALPFILHMTHEQCERLLELTFRKSEYQEICQRIYGGRQEVNGKVYVKVLATDMSYLREALIKPDVAECKDFFREIIDNIHT